MKNVGQPMQAKAFNRAKQKTAYSNEWCGNAGEKQ
jgi:hypothetical protein